MTNASQLSDSDTQPYTRFLFCQVLNYKSTIIWGWCHATKRCQAQHKREVHTEVSSQRSSTTVSVGWKENLSHPTCPTHKGVYWGREPERPAEGQYSWWETRSAVSPFSLSLGVGEGRNLSASAKGQVNKRDAQPNPHLVIGHSCSTAENWKDDPDTLLFLPRVCNSKIITLSMRKGLTLWLRW